MSTRSLHGGQRDVYQFGNLPHVTATVFATSLVIILMNFDIEGSQVLTVDYGTATASAVRVTQHLSHNDSLNLRLLTGAASAWCEHLLHPQVHRSDR